MKCDWENGPIAHVPNKDDEGTHSEDHTGKVDRRNHDGISEFPTNADVHIPVCGPLFVEDIVMDDRFSNEQHANDEDQDLNWSRRSHV